MDGKWAAPRMVPINHAIGFINCNIDYSRFQPFNASFHFRTSDIDRSNFIVKTHRQTLYSL